MAVTHWGPKDPEAIRDFGVDWTLDVPGGETISTSTWLLDGVAWPVDADLEKVAVSIETPAVKTVIRLGGGVLGTKYEVTNHVVFSDGQEDDWTEKLRVRAR